MKVYFLKFMVIGGPTYSKDHSEEKENLLLSLHGLPFFNYQQGIFYMHHPICSTDRIVYTILFCNTSYGTLDGM